MLKKSLFLALSLLLVVSFSAFAGEGSDTVGGGKLLPQLRYGYSATDWRTSALFANTFRNWETNAHSYYLQANWGILNNVDLIGIVGGQSFAMESLDANVHRDEMFMWGLGVRTTFFRADNGFYVGGGALFTHSFGSDFKDNFGWTISLSVYRVTPELHIGWHIPNTGLTPYLGVDYTYLRGMGEFRQPGNSGEMEYRLEDPVYMFVGLDHYITDRLYLNVEGRTNFAGGWGIEGGIGYLFDICPKPAPAPAPAPAPVIEPKLEPMSKN
jgi:hypothetical protein